MKQPLCAHRVRVHRDDERGFALLLVFLMAAGVAIMLYKQMPRVAFEIQRDKEQTLIDRGKQYQRAIQLYVVANKKFPSKIEDLENTNDKRYLRRRYIDPMTGKDEWRLIHVNAAGVLTDSLVEKPPTTPDGKPASQTNGPSPTSNTTLTSNTTGTNTTTDPNATNGPQEKNAAVYQRPSDLVGQAYSQPTTADPNDPSTWAPITLTPSTTPGQTNRPNAAVGFNGGLPGQNGTQPGAPAPSIPGVPGIGQPGFNPSQNQFRIENGQLVPMNPQQGNAQSGTPQPNIQPGQPVNSQTGGVQPTPVTNFPPLPNGVGAPPSAATGAPQQNPIQMINQMLTNPSPVTAGLNNVNSPNMVTGGLAGVASNFKGPSIKIYNDRQKYQEWEFVYKLNNGAKPGQNTNPLNPNGSNPAGLGGLSTNGLGINNPQPTTPQTTGTPPTTGNP